MLGVKYALEKITGRVLSERALTSGNDFVQLAKNLSNKTLPAHFNEVKESKDREELKKGYFLVLENDVIEYSNQIYRGVKKIYTPKEIKVIMEKEKTIMVK